MESSVPSTAQGVPEGYAPLIRADGTRSHIPQYLVLATAQAFDGYRRRLGQGRNDLEWGVRIFTIVSTGISAVYVTRLLSAHALWHGADI